LCAHDNFAPRIKPYERDRSQEKGLWRV
jgi:hypothetical protein